MEKQVWKRSPIKADGQVVRAVIKAAPIAQSTINTPAAISTSSVSNIMSNTPSQGKHVVTSKMEDRSAGQEQKEAFDNNLKASLGALYDVTSPINKKNDMTPVSSPVLSRKSSSKTSPTISGTSSPKNNGNSPSGSKYSDETKTSPMQHSPSPYVSQSNNHFLAASHGNNIFNISNFPVINTKIDEVNQIDSEYYYDFLNNVNYQLASWGIEVSKNDEDQALSEKEGDLLLQSCIKCHQEFVKQGMFL